MTAIFDEKMFITQPGQGTAIRISLHSKMFCLATYYLGQLPIQNIKISSKPVRRFCKKIFISCLGHYTEYRNFPEDTASEVGKWSP
jgi:hypothetical protein